MGQNTTLKITIAPKGHYTMTLNKKPSWIKRFFMEHLLGMVWVDDL